MLWYSNYDLPNCKQNLNIIMYTVKRKQVICYLSFRWVNMLHAWTINCLRIQNTLLQSCTSPPKHDLYIFAISQECWNNFISPMPDYSLVMWMGKCLKLCFWILMLTHLKLISYISYLVLMVPIEGKISLCFDYSKFITGVHHFLNCNSCYTKLWS